MNMKKIENIQNYTRKNDDWTDEIENYLQNDITFDEDAIVYSDMASITCSGDEIGIIKDAEITYIDDQHYYAVIEDDLGDYAVISGSRDSSSKLEEFIDSELSSDEFSSEDETTFESYDVEFKIVSNEDDEIYVEGYVTINDAEAEDVEWHFWDGSQYSSQRKIHHDGIKITGATVEQEKEIAQFESDLADGGIWIDDMILQSKDTENETYVREYVTLIINEGADFCQEEDF